MAIVNANALIAGLGGKLNYFANPRGEGGTVGTIGGAGVVPTGYSTNQGQGIFLDYLGQFTVNGIPCTRWRYHGTTTANATMGINPWRAVPAMAQGSPYGTTMTESFWVRLVAGSVAGISSFNFWGDVRDATNAVVGGLIASPFTPNATLTRLSSSVTGFTAGTPPYSVIGAGTVFYSQFGAGTVIDFTVDIGGWQLEILNPPPSSLILPPVGAPLATQRGIEAMPLIDREIANTGIGGAGNVQADGSVQRPAAALIAGTGSVRATVVASRQAAAQVDGAGGKVNYIRNPRSEGAVIGTPGALPTYWVIAKQYDLAIDVIGIGNEGGIPYVDLHIYGNTGNVNVTDAVNTNIQPDGFLNSVPSRVGLTWTGTIYQRWISGSTNNIADFRVIVQEIDQAGQWLTQGATIFQPSSAPLVTQGVFCTWTISQATTRSLSLGFQLHYTGSGVGGAGGLPINITIRFGASQLELGSLSPLILPPPGAPQASARALLGMPLISREIASGTIGGVGNVQADASVLCVANALIAGLGGKINYIPNPRGEGGTPGTVGGGAILPTNYNVNVAGTGVTLQYLGQFNVNGIDVTRWRYFGTTVVDSAALGINPWRGPTLISGIPNNATHTESFWVRMVDATDVSGIVTFRAWGSVYDKNLAVAFSPNNVFSMTSTLTRIVFNNWSYGTNGPYLINGIGTVFYCNLAGSTVDFTFDIGGWQFEILTTVSSLILPPVGAPAQTQRGIEAMPLISREIAAASAGGQGGVRAGATSLVAAAVASLGGAGGVRASGVVFAQAGAGVIPGQGGLRAAAGKLAQAAARITGLGAYTTDTLLQGQTPGRAMISGLGQLRIGDPARGFGASTTLAGAGSLNARANVRAASRTALTGAGTVRAVASVARPASARIAGAGSVKLGPSWRMIHALADIAGRAFLRAVETVARPGAGPIAGAGRVRADADVHVAVHAAARIGGTGTPRVTGSTALMSAHARVAANGTVAASGLHTTPGAAHVGGFGHLAAHAAVLAHGAARVAGRGTIAARVSYFVYHASARIAGAGGVRPTARVAHIVHAMIRGAGRLVATPMAHQRLQVGGSVTAGAGRVRARVSRLILAGRARIAGTGGVHAHGSKFFPAASRIGGTGAVHANAVKAPRFGAAHIGGVGGVHANAKRIVHARVRIDATGGVHAHIVVRARVGAVIPGQGRIHARAAELLQARVRIGGTGHLAASGRVIGPKQVSAAIGGVGHVHADPFVPREREAALGVFIPYTHREVAL